MDSSAVCLSSTRKATRFLQYLALNPVAAGRAAKPEDWPWSSYQYALGLGELPAFLSLQDMWLAFGRSDCGRLADFVAAGQQDAFTNPLLHGSTGLAERLATHLKPYQATRDYVHAARFAARPSLGSLLEGCVDREALEDAARAAFHQHAYTLAYRRARSFLPGERGHRLHRQKARRRGQILFLARLSSSEAGRPRCVVTRIRSVVGSWIH